jgi:hypothetical protein
LEREALQESMNSSVLDCLGAIALLLGRLDSPGLAIHILTLDTVMDALLEFVNDGRWSSADTLLLAVSRMPGSELVLEHLFNQALFVGHLTLLARLLPFLGRSSGIVDMVHRTADAAYQKSPAFKNALYCLRSVTEGLQLRDGGSVGAMLEREFIPGLEALYKSTDSRSARRKRGGLLQSKLHRMARKGGFRLADSEGTALAAMDPE